MKLKQIKKGYKCPNCKKFGLKPFYKWSCCYNDDREYEGHREEGAYNYYKCMNCFAEFVELKG